MRKTPPGPEASEGAAPPATGVAAGDRGIEQTLGRTALLLNALSREQRNGMRFTDLMHETGFSKATLHRLLAGLHANGFIETEGGGGRYFLGYQLSAWASGALRRKGLAEQVEPIVRALAERVRDTAYFSLRARDMAVCLALQEGSAVVRALPLNPGDHSALGVGSAAVAILAGIEDAAEVQRILDSPAHRAYCERRQVPRAHIDKHLERTRRLGYAFVDDLNPDMTGVAVAVHGPDGQVRGAVSVAAIPSRVTEGERLNTLLGELRSAAARLDAVLQGLGPAG